MSHYDSKYFDWQKSIGEFGGWANSRKFKDSISKDDTVLDFGCGGGFLLNNLECKMKVGIEVNPSAADNVKKLGVSHYFSTNEALMDLGEESIDVIISNHALEHTFDPLQELKNLFPILKKGGIIHFVVPCDSVYRQFNPDNIDKHLYSWSPMNLGNLFEEAGYSVEFTKSLIHKWPPSYRKIAKLGWPIFNVACLVYGRIERSWFQVEIKAKKII